MEEEQQRSAQEELEKWQDEEHRKMEDGVSIALEDAGREEIPGFPPLLLSFSFVCA